MKRLIALIAGALVVYTMTGCAAMQSKSMDTQEINTVRYVYSACHMFAKDHDGQMPSGMDALAPYLGKQFDLSQVELLSVGKVSEIKNPDSVVQVRSKHISSAGKHAVAFADGHCEMLADK